MAAAARSANADLQEPTLEERRPVEELLESFFFHPIIAYWFVAAELVGPGLSKPLREEDGRSFAALALRLKLDRRLFSAMEGARPLHRALLWDRAQRVGVLPPISKGRADASRDPVVRREQLGGQRYLPRTIRGVDAREVMVAELERHRDGLSAPWVLLAGPPRSGKTRFLIEMGVFYRFEFERSAIIEGNAALPATARAEERLELERQIVAAIQDWYPRNGLTADYAVLVNWLVRQGEGGGDTAFLFVDDLDSVEVLSALARSLPPSVQLVAVTRGSDAEASGRLLTLDPMSDEDKVAILVEGGRPSDARSAASQQIVTRLGDDLNALVLASRLLMYCRPPELLEWMETEAREWPGERDGAVSLCLRVLYRQFGMADTTSEEALAWNLLCALTWLAPDRPVDLELLRRCLRDPETSRDPLARHVLRAVDSLGRLRLVGRLEGRPCVSAAVQEAVRDLRPAAFDARRGAVARALAEVVPRRYPELLVYAVPVTGEEDESLLEHALAFVTKLVDPSTPAEPDGPNGRAGAEDLEGPERWGLWRLFVAVLRRLTRIGRRSEAASLADTLWRIAGEAGLLKQIRVGKRVVDERIELLSVYSALLESMGQRTAFGVGGDQELDRARVDAAAAFITALEGEIEHPRPKPASSASSPLQGKALQLGGAAGAEDADDEALEAARPHRLLSLSWRRLAWLKGGDDAAAIAERRRLHDLARSRARAVADVDPCLEADVLVERENDILRVLAVDRSRTFGPGEKEREIADARVSVGEALRIYGRVRDAGGPVDLRIGYALTLLAKSELDLLDLAARVSGAHGVEAIRIALEGVTALRGDTTVACLTMARIRTPLHGTVLAQRRRAEIQVVDLLLLAVARAGSAWREERDGLVHHAAQCVAGLRSVLDGLILSCGADWPKRSRDGSRMREAAGAVMVYARLSCLFAILIEPTESARELVADAGRLLDDALDESDSTWREGFSRLLAWDQRMVGALADVCQGRGSSALRQMWSEPRDRLNAPRQNLITFLRISLENSAPAR